MLFKDLKKIVGLDGIFSLTGYTIICPGMAKVFLGMHNWCNNSVSFNTIFFITHSNPSLEPHFPFFGNNTSAVVADSNSTTSTFVGFEKILNHDQLLRAFERSFANFLPLLSLGGGGDIKVG
jgi:hypothetical protein